MGDVESDLDDVLEDALAAAPTRGNEPSLLGDAMCPRLSASSSIVSPVSAPVKTGIGLGE